MMDKDMTTQEQEVAEAPLEVTENQRNGAENSDTAAATAAPEAGSDAKIAELQRLHEEAKSKYIYLLSDFENFKRNAAKERYELMQTAGRDILAALLPILDDFDRAAKNGALSEGTTLIHQKLVSTLKQKGLSALDLNAGDDFNADEQEAVAEIPAASDELKGKIVDVLEPGYMLSGKIIRFPKVVVGK